jgi:6-phosphogluconolactonase (cycloisomerase 2 family)
MKISSNSERLALVNYYSQKLEVFNFNPASGNLSLLSSISLDEPDGRLYGLEFSPSSRYLYVTRNSCDILQLDLNSELKAINVIKGSNTPP